MSISPFVVGPRVEVRPVGLGVAYETPSGAFVVVDVDDDGLVTGLTASNLAPADPGPLDASGCRRPPVADVVLAPIVPLSLGGCAVRAGDALLAVHRSHLDVLRRREDALQALAAGGTLTLRTRVTWAPTTFVGASPRMRRCAGLVDHVAVHDDRGVITGEHDLAWPGDVALDGGDVAAADDPWPSAVARLEATSEGALDRALEDVDRRLADVAPGTRTAPAPWLARAVLGRTERRLLACRRVDVARRPIGDEGLVRMVKSTAMAAIGELDVRRTGLTARGVKALASAPWAWTLSSLDVSENELGDDGLSSLATSSAFLELDRLVLRDVVAPSARAILPKARAWHPRRLELDGLGLGPDGIAALLASPSASRLEHLDAGRNALGDAGALAIARSPIVRTLRVLRLGGNDIGAPGRRALAEAFRGELLET